MQSTGVQMLSFPQHGDERGHLVVVEGLKDVPFEIRRMFYIYGSDANVVRGRHANRKSEFVFINVAGQSKVRVDDGRGNEAVFSINRVAVPYEQARLRAKRDLRETVTDVMRLLK